MLQRHFLNLRIRELALGVLNRNHEIGSIEKLGTISVTSGPNPTAEYRYDWTEQTEPHAGPQYSPQIKH